MPSPAPTRKCPAGPSSLTPELLMYNAWSCCSANGRRFAAPRSPLSNFCSAASFIARVARARPFSQHPSPLSNTPLVPTAGCSGRCSLIPFYIRSPAKGCSVSTSAEAWLTATAGELECGSHVPTQSRTVCWPPLPSPESVFKNPPVPPG